MNTTIQDKVLLGTANTDGTWTGVTSGTSIALPPGQHQAFAVAFIGNGTTSGGTILIEEAYWTTDQVAYNGTWSQIQSVTASDVTGGAQKVVHIAPNALFAVRVRISSNITGGGGISAAVRYS